MLLSLLLQYSETFEKELTLGKDIAIYMFLVLALSLLISNNAVGRFSGFYENVLNFTGLIAVISSLIFLRLRIVSFSIYVVILSILTFMSQSKALAVVLLSSSLIYVFRMSKSLALVLVLFAIGSVLAFFFLYRFRISNGYILPSAGSDLR